MDFLNVQLFLLLYFLRPQDWIPGLDGARPVLLNMAAAIFATLFRRDGLSLKTLLQTPHDWIMLAYFCWVVGTAGEPLDALGDCYSRFVFYVVTVLALSSWHRMRQLLTWWTVLLLIVAALATGSLTGFDPTGSAAATLIEKGRLSFNTMMLNNPNALGHTVGVAIPLVYFAFFWRRDALRRIAAPALIALAAFCVYETQSKGAYLVGAATLAASQMFGRPKSAQLAVIAVAAMTGLVALSQLPRMETLTSSDEGIQGRLLSWQFARDTMKERPAGTGWKKFVSRIRRQNEWHDIATHGSYVQIGAALGYGGLFLYLGVLYSGFRTLITTVPGDDEQERVRRMLFCLLLSYTLSNWMIDRAYHTEFFVIAAAIGAFHRLTRSPESDAVESVPAVPQPAGGDLPAAGPDCAPPATAGTATMETPGGQWQRFGFVDLACISALLWTVLSFWDFILKHF